MAAAHALLDHAVLRVVQHDEDGRNAIGDGRAELVLHEHGAVADDGDASLSGGDRGAQDARGGMAHRTPTDRRAETTGPAKAQTMVGPRIAVAAIDEDR